MDSILVFGTVVLVMIFTILPQVVLLHVVTKLLKLERASFKKALFTILISIPIGFLLLLFVGMAGSFVPAQMIQIVADATYFMVVMGVCAAVIVRQYKTSLRNALMAGVAIALLSSLILAVFTYLIEFVSFS